MPAFKVVRWSWVCGMPCALAENTKEKGKRHPTKHFQACLPEPKGS
jgi:hypothetical protein